MRTPLSGILLRRFLLATIVFAAKPTRADVTYPNGPQIAKDGTAVVIEDYARLPISSRTLPPFGEQTNDLRDQLARINFLRCEPTNAPLAAARIFVCDNNRNLYILSRTTNPLSTNAFTPYINFEHVFPKFVNNVGFAGGLITVQFDPEYAINGKFYTVHTENPAKAGSATPTNGFLPGVDFSGYTNTAPVNPPGSSVVRQGVLVEWTDTNLNNATFEGTAREILRVGFTSDIHPMGDLLFNPLAHSGDPDYRNLYISDGDGGAGEDDASPHAIPQRLDAIEGKILRITPDINLRPSDQLSANGRYRIPTTGTDTNPFVGLSLPNLRKEIFAYGFRNCHRITWDPVSNLIIENDIGLYSWEEVNIIHKGANYGYAEREGPEQLFVANNGLTGSQLGIPFTNSDALTVTGIVGTVTPIYPVATYSHEDGDSISSGFVYRGKLMPQLYGKYIFGDITTGRIFYCDLAEMIANDDGDRNTLATIHELQIVFKGQARRLFDVIANEYRSRGGTASGRALPGGASATNGKDPDGINYGSGRADIRLGMDSDGELYVMSKGDGMIRRFVSVVVPPTVNSLSATNGVITLTWPSISNRVYRVQYKNSITDTNWTDIPGDVTATNGTASKTDPFGTTNRFIGCSCHNSVGGGPLTNNRGGAAAPSHLLRQG